MTRRYLLDSGPAFDFAFRRNGIYERSAERRRRGAIVGTCVPVLGEMVGGIEGSDSRDRSMATFQRHINQLVLWPYEKAAAWEFGCIIADLRRRGRPMQQIDIMLAAIAITLGDCTVVTTDSDLSAITGLRVENWLS